jgi:hypothetical protein
MARLPASVVQIPPMTVARCQCVTSIPMSCPLAIIRKDQHRSDRQRLLWRYQVRRSCPAPFKQEVKRLLQNSSDNELYTR